MKGTCTYDGCDEEALKTSKDGHCIFHERDEHKDTEEFQKCLQAKLKNQDYQFQGYFFVGKILFSENVFLKDVDFSKAHFSGDVHFEKTQFSGKAFFNGAKFHGRAIFLGARFLREGQAQFRDVVFSGDALFSGAKFSGEALFWSAKFLRDAVFWHAGFSEHVLFLDATFSGEGRSDFRDVTFSGTADFSSAKFMGDVLFWQSKFSGNVIFKSTRFSGDGRVDFQDVTFSGDALFHSAKFSGDVLFEGATFSKEANFESANFWGEVDFGTLDLGTLRLAGSNIDAVDLTDAQWSSDFKNVYEKTAKGIEDYEKAEEVYRKVKINYHRTGNYNNGAEFYYREMESRRKQIGFKNVSIINEFFQHFGHNFLRFYCGYGEKPLRVIGCSVATVFACAVLYMLSGIYDSAGSGLIRHDLIHWPFGFNLNAIIQSLKDFWTCLYYSVITFTTVGYGDIRPTVGFARTLAMAEGFFGAFSMALFVLTFGRKMTR